jgi:hypothetical protein
MNRIPRQAIALAVTALAASGAYAQTQGEADVLREASGRREGISFHKPGLDLSLYGLLDLTFVSQSNANANGDRLSNFTTPWFSGSRWGMIGSRNLPDGAPSLIFKLEGEFVVATGKFDTDNTIFNRDATFLDLEIAAATLTAQVPNLILQPIVENAIRHGIAAKIEPGSIRISSERQGDRLRIQIRDDGPGFASNTRSGNGYREGIGLTNARARLARLYGQDHVLELSNGREGGAIVTLEMPFHARDVAAYETAGTASG